MYGGGAVTSVSDQASPTNSVGPGQEGNDIARGERASSNKHGASEVMPDEWARGSDSWTLSDCCSWYEVATVSDPPDDVVDIAMPVSTSADGGTPHASTSDSEGKS